MEARPALAAIATMRAAYDELAGLGLDTLTHPELLAVLGELETLCRQLPTQSHRILARLTAEASPMGLGATTWRDVLTGRLRISRAEAGRRLAEASELGPRTAVSGQPLDPKLGATAAAQAVGAIGAEHVRIIRAFFERLPSWVDLTTRAQAEATLVRAASGSGPDALRKAAERLACLIDQDGPAPDDAERARRRHLSIGRQGADGMTPFQGLLDPQARATVDAILAKWAAPGMCNPDDENPCITGTPSQEQITGDTRTLGQRQHDALTAIGRSVISSRGARAAQRAARVDHRLDHPAGVGIRVGVGGHRRRRPAADVRGDPGGHPRPSLPGRLRREARRGAAVFRSGQTLRLTGTTDRAARA